MTGVLVGLLGEQLLVVGLDEWDGEDDEDGRVQLDSIARKALVVHSEQRTGSHS